MVKIAYATPRPRQRQPVSGSQWVALPLSIAPYPVLVLCLLIGDTSAFPAVVYVGGVIAQVAALIANFSTRSRNLVVTIIVVSLSGLYLFSTMLLLGVLIYMMIEFPHGIGH